ncbi:alpha-xylosidase [Georgenia halophila]|uniref:Alpha-xylosidase n=1 Tax=Georgenia halophila TaxID=620889 RepID=A0ABP8KTX8_9MICO
MKFTDGYWQVRPGTTILRPQFVDDAIVGERSLRVFAATAPIATRGDTLNRPMVSFTFDSPMDDVVGVRIDHFTGGRELTPSFALHRDEAPVRVETTGGTPPERVAGNGHPPHDRRNATLTAGDLSARVNLDGGWHLEFLAGGRVLTSSEDRSVGLISRDDGTHFVREQLMAGVGEHVYGLGERFGPLVKNGQSVDIWNADGGTASDLAYKNVPFYLTDHGYGVFVDHPERVSFEVGTEVVSRVQFSVEGQSLQYYVIYGPTPKEILRKYTALTGRPARVPAWSYGTWLSTSFTTDYDEETVTSFVDGMAERDLPLSVFHFDCFWMRRFHWCDFVWDPATFPDPEGMLRRLKAKGLKICLWTNPYIAQRSHLFDEGKALGYLVTRADGSVWQWDMWQAGMALVDFTNPDATAWYIDKLRSLLHQGVDAFKTDFGERIPTDVVWHDGSDPERMHNYYTHLYNEAVFRLLEEERGKGEAVLFARSATAGGQQFPVHWGGDCESTFVSMAESLRGGLSLAASGFGFWSHDIGGFEGTPDPAVFKRWVAFGMLSSHSRFHGSDSYRVPWAFDEEAVEVTRAFSKLKMTLMPYLMALGEEAHRDGVPIMRPMVLEFPEDPGAATVETQYMLGESLLVAPVFSASGEVDVYLPPGTWTDALTGEKIVGPRWVHQVHDFMSVPLLVRAGTVLPVGAVTDRPDYDYAERLTLRVYELTDGESRTVVVPTPDGEPGATYVVSRDGDEIRAVADGTDRPWSLHVIGAGEPVHADAGDLVLSAAATHPSGELSLPR